MAKFVNLFSLSVYRDEIVLDNDYKAQLIQAILEMEESRTRRKPDTAWLGDTEGHEFLFQNPLFEDLFRQIAAKVKQYAIDLGLNTDLIDFYFQRAWATVTRTGERIHEHSHSQSNVSFAFYLAKPDRSGGISFVTYNHPNEISEGIFTPAKHKLGFIANPSMLTWNNVHIEPKENEIIIFPSKTLHATVPNESDQPRISISADITTMLSQSHGHETMMPHFSNWRSFDG